MAEEPPAKRGRRPDGSVVLDVGGERFRTTMATLRSFPSSFFGAIASGRHTVNWDEDGSLFIDRSPKHFAMILEYLRNGKGTPLAFQTEQQLDEVRCEAEFYGLEHLATKCRRFKIFDMHLMSCSAGRSSHFGVLAGMRHAAAIFDVVDPDNFEVTFAGRGESSADDWSHLFGITNEPGVLIGIVPVDADLTQEWVECANPLPTAAPGPFTSGRGYVCNWSRSRTRYPLSAEAAAPFWPKRVKLPPGFVNGVACLLTVCLFSDSKDERFQADGFLTQCVVRGEVNIDPEMNRWWSRPHGSVGLRFKRTSDRCTLQVRLHDDDTEVLFYDFDIPRLGLDPKLPYRPVIFFGTKQSVDVAVDFDDGDE